MAETVLDNGARILSERIPGVRSAAVGVWVLHGAAHEPAALAGVSHLLEHMVFKGTRKRTARELAIALEGRGGSLDAYTSREHTSYQARVLDQDVPLALDVLADLVLHPLLRSDDLELEREVIMEEIAQVEDTPDDLVFERHGSRFWLD
ncbi:MAG: pitrilysin family protein, partial [Gemmatimonadota bacterium]